MAHQHWPRISLITLLLTTASLHAQPELKLRPELAVNVDTAVQKEMEKQGLVGVAIGILDSQQIIYLNGYGLADREKKVPVTKDSIFNWASNSKPLAAVAAMQLVEKKQLDLDVDIRKYVPEFPEKDHVITMRQLLCHQSGIQHYGIVTSTKRTYSTKLPHHDPVLALDVFNRTPLSYKPGEKYVYSSYGYVLASAVIQNAGKQPFVEQIEKRIATPLGMKSLQLDMDFHDQPHWTVGYTKVAGSVVRAREEAHYWKHGAGGFKSNIVDFARWAQGLLHYKLVSETIEKQMWTRQATSDGKLTTMGLGFSIDEQNGLRVSHNGKQDETTTRMVIYPLKNHGIVVMTNCGYGDPAAITTVIYQALSQK